MPFSKQIELRAKKEIIDAINIVLDRYLKEGLTINQIKKYFSKKLAQNLLIKDINEAGSKYFDDIKEYKQFVKSVLRDTLYDRKSEIETMELQKENKNIIKFSEFDKQNEALDYKDISAEYLFDDIGFANDDIDILASYFKTKEDYIEVKNKDYCIYTITDFKTDIMKNNRVKMDVLLLADFQLEKMKDNVTRKILSGIYEQIPQDVEYMGVLVKPHTILDKEKLKESIDIIVDKHIINIISNVTKYHFESKYGEDKYYIWKKVK
jgi:hypothetical protein